MLVFNYYYNAYDEIDVYSIDGNGTSSTNVALIVGSTIGGVFGFVILIFCILVCVSYC